MRSGGYPGDHDPARARVHDWERGQDLLKGGAVAPPRGDRGEAEGRSLPGQCPWLKITNQAYTQLEGQRSLLPPQGRTLVDQVVCMSNP
jgi:hypothetical protein